MRRSPVPALVFRVSVMRVRGTHSVSVRRLLVACAWGFALLSCGREATAPYGGARMARSLSLAPVFPRAYQQLPGAFALAPFTRVRVLFVRATGATALDTTVAFPATADSLALGFAVPLSPDAPAAGEPLTAFVYCLDSRGDTLFKGGPVPAFASARADTPGVITVALLYAGTGANAASVRITPKTLTAAPGDHFTFTTSALDASGQAVAGAPVVFRAADTTLAIIGLPTSGAGHAITAPDAHGSTLVIAQLITGAADTAVLTVQTPAAPTAGPAATLTFSAQPGGSTAGSTLAPAIAVTARDTAGNVATSFTGAVSLSLGGGPAGAVLSGTTTANAVAGVAHFTTPALTLAGPGYRIVATAAGIPPDSSAAFAVTAAGAATIAASSGDHQTGTPAALLGAPVGVAVSDIYGNPVSGVTVSWGVTGGGGTVASATTTTNAAGVATVGWTLGTALGAQSASAFSPGLGGSPLAFSATAVAGAATRLVMSAIPASATAGAAIGPAITVQARDGLNNLQPSFTGNVTLSLGANPGGGALAGSTTVAAVSGVATFSGLSLAKAAAGYRLAATAGTLTPDTSATFTVVPATAASIAITGGSAQTGSVSSTLAAPLGVTVSDAFGNPVGLTNVQFAVASGGGTLSSGAVPTNAAGVATAAWTLGALTGAQSVTATASSLAGSPLTFSATAVAGGAAKLAISAQPSSAAAGAAISPPVIVQVKDAAGNLATTYSGSVSLALAANPGGATLGGATTVAAVGGVATFSNVSLNKAAGGYTLAASASGLAGDTSTPFATTAAAAATVSGAGGDGQAGVTRSTLPVPLVAAVTDAFGNPVAGVSVAWTITAGRGSVSLASSNTDALGVATTVWTLGPITGGGGVTATAAGLAGSPVSFTSTAFASVATKLAIVTQPANVAAGAAIAPSIVVQALDSTNNPVSAFTGSVSLAIGTNPGAATLGGATTVTASGGVATFTGITLNKAGTGYTLVASAGGLTAAGSAGFNVANGAPAALAVSTGNSQTSAAGTALASALAVIVTDAGGNPVPGVNVNWSIAGGGGSLGVSSTATNGAGVASTTWTLGALAGTQSVTASAGGVPGPPVTFTATATAGVATRLAITVQPGSVTAGVNIAPSLVVTAEDASGNVATTFSGSVALALSTNPGGATLSGTTSVNSVAGVATFTSVSLDKAASGYRISATAGALAQGNSAPFAIAAAAPATLTVNGGNGQAGAIALALGLPLSVTVTDAFGNPVAGVSVNWTVGVGGGSLGGAATTTNSAGVAANSWTLGSLLGAQTVTATAGGIAGSPAAFSATALAGVAARLVMSVQPVSTIAGSALGLVATAEDALGNVATSFTGAVSLGFGANPGNASLAGATSVNAVAGIATFTGISIVKAAPGYSLAANASGLVAATSGTFEIGAAAPASAVVSGVSGQSGTIGQLLGAPVAVTVLDAYANPVPNVTVNWSVATGGGFLSNSTVQTNSSGVATNAWTLGTVLGTQTVTAAPVALANSPVTITATGLVGAAARLVVSSVPAIVTAGSAIGPSIVVTAEDAFGNFVPSFNGVVSLAVGTNPGADALAGTTGVTAVGGVATFSDVSLTRAAVGYTIIASATGVTPATTSSFSVGAGAAAAVAKAGGDNQPNLLLSLLGLLLPTPLSVRVTDAFGNPVGGMTVSWAVTLGSARLGNPSSQTNASGVATNDTVTLTGLLGGLRQVTASVTGVTAAVFSETVIL
ncbi:MAG: Ig-like domain-containing protein [Gemmatimonadales bacterium]